ncbi:MAG: pseudaminic acid synthase [Oceanospirillaceae bacterium]|nr:pseudaminic acid synthase [Oceanospirillaceae bacterium]
MRSVNIEGKIISSGGKPFIVAELSGNHNQSIQRAKDLIDCAAEAGCDAVKLQTYTADTMTLNLNSGEFYVSDKNNLWHGYTLHSLYDKAHTPWEWHAELFSYIRNKGMVPFSSPFDETAVDFLESIACPVYKVASFEVTDIPLIRKIAKTGKPIIMSLGMASLSEIEEAVGCARDNGCKDLILLKCTSTYPADPASSNILTIPHLSTMFACLTGISDHTFGTGVSVAATALGAVLIEKHITIDRNDGGVDSSFSMEPHEFKMLVQEVNRAWLALGKVNYGAVSDLEKKSKDYRRSLYVSEPVKKGDVLGAHNIAVVRPAKGLPPKYYDNVVGAIARHDMPVGHPLAWSDISSDA